MSERGSSKPNRLRTSLTAGVTAAVAIAAMSGCGFKGFGDKLPTSNPNIPVATGNLGDCGHPAASKPSGSNADDSRLTLKFDASHKRYQGDKGPSSIPANALKALVQVHEAKGDTVGSGGAVKANGHYFVLTASTNLRAGEPLKDISLADTDSNPLLAKSGCEYDKLAVIELADGSVTPIIKKSALTIGKAAGRGTIVGMVTNQTHLDGTERVSGDVADYTALALGADKRQSGVGIALDGIDVYNYGKADNQILEGNDAAQGALMVNIQEGSLAGIEFAADRDPTSHDDLKSKYNVVSRSGQRPGSELSLVYYLTPSYLTNGITAVENYANAAKAAP